ncbi:MAG: hypothetical protein LUD72_05165 [Bacteroidales bacterium]|nr:hypothetical protein [Bacteroidales bacterium]
MMSPKTDGKAQESKHDRFVRVAEGRTNKIIEMIRLLGNCANRSNYAYTDDDVKQIFSAIDKELKSTRKRFEGVGDVEEKFTLR